MAVTEGPRTPERLREKSPEEGDRLSPDTINRLSSVAGSTKGCLDGIAVLQALGTDSRNGPVLRRLSANAGAPLPAATEGRVRPDGPAGAARCGARLPRLSGKDGAVFVKDEVGKWEKEGEQVANIRRCAASNASSTYQ